VSVREGKEISPWGPIISERRAQACHVFEACFGTVVCYRRTSYNNLGFGHDRLVEPLARRASVPAPLQVPSVPLVDMGTLKTDH
jgi:hypothetical protein